MWTASMSIVELFERVRHKTVLKPVLGAGLTRHILSKTLQH